MFFIVFLIFTFKIVLTQLPCSEVFDKWQIKKRKQAKCQLLEALLMFLNECVIFQEQYKFSITPFIVNPLLNIINMNHKSKNINGYTYYLSDTYISSLAYTIVLDKSTVNSLQHCNRFWHKVIAIYDTLPFCDKLLKKYISDDNMIQKLYRYILQRIDNCEAWDTQGAWKLLHLLIDSDDSGYYNNILDKLIDNISKNRNKLLFARYASNELVKLMTNDKTV